MAEPTLQDVLEGIATLRAEMATKSDLARVESKVDAHRAETDAHRAETDAHRRETAKRFDDLDAELAKHADPVHRKLEEDVAALRKQVGKTAKKAARPVVRRPRRG